MFWSSTHGEGGENSKEEEKHQFLSKLELAPHSLENAGQAKSDTFRRGGLHGSLGNFFSLYGTIALSSAVFGVHTAAGARR